MRVCLRISCFVPPKHSITPSLMSLRIELFHTVFSQFTILQIIKSIKQFGSFTCVILLSLLVISFIWIQFFRGAKSRTVPILMYCSFISLSILDGSLSNHVVSSVSLALLVLSTVHRSENSAWEMDARRAVIWFTAILYLVTGLHKLNDGFFDPHYSCASLYVSGSITWVPLSILEITEIHACLSFLVRYAPIMAVIFELGIPIPLLLSTVWDTKNFSVIRSALFVGATFHAILALPPSPLSVYPFSSIMVPMYLLMVPRECQGVENFWNWWTNWRIGIAVVIVAFVSQNATRVLFNEQDLFEYPNYGLWAISVIWNSVAWTVMMYSLLSVGRSGKSIGSSRPRPMAYCVILGLLIFGLTPYIGLRNYPALAMFSNLRTEGSNPNHWVPSWDLLGYQKDYVEVLDTNIDVVRDMQVNLGTLFPQKLKETNTLLGLSNEFYICPPKWPYENPDGLQTPFSVPFIELRRRLSKTRDSLSHDSFVEYVRHRPGLNNSHVLLRMSDISDGTDVFKALSWFEELFVKFRTFSDSYSPCRH